MAFWNCEATQVDGSFKLFVRPGAHKGAVRYDRPKYEVYIARQLAALASASLPSTRQACGNEIVVA